MVCGFGGLANANLELSKRANDLNSYTDISTKQYTVGILIETVW